MIELKPELLETLEQSAAHNSRSVSDLVNEAVVERYLRDQRRIQLQEEIEAYKAMHPQLVQKHLGEWVAVYKGKKVDEDADGSALHQRVRQKYGHAAVLIRQVQAHRSNRKFIGARGAQVKSNDQVPLWCPLLSVRAQHRNSARAACRSIAP